MCSKTKLVICVIAFLFFGFNNFCYAQAHNEKGMLVVDGLVSGYNHDPSRKLFQKEKQIILEGTLERVVMNVSEGGKPITTVYTNKKGEFELKLSLGKIYKIELLKIGHAKSVLLIDVKSVPPEISKRGIRFTRAELVLNSFQSKDTSQINQPFGRLYYDARKKIIDFEPARIEIKTGLFSKGEEPDISAYMMKRAVIRNKDNISNDNTAKENVLKEQKKTPNNFHDQPAEESAEKDTTENKMPISRVLSEFNLAPHTGIEALNEKDIALRESEIQEAQRQIEKDKLNASTRQDSLIIKEREYILKTAVIELSNAKKMIELQKNKISLQKMQLLLAACSLLILFSLLFIIYKQYKEKNRTNIILKEQNQKITDSINYAKHIQQSILPQETEIKKLLPDSFIYYQPRDIVSGDFYWCSEIEGKIIIAAVDCTGHGVPGAFMSLIGNTLLNEIINEQHILRPSSILMQLHLGIINSLHQNADERNSQDGMEMSLCVIDITKDIIEFAGAMNPIYIVKDNLLTSIKPDIQAIGGINSAARKHRKVEFTDQQIPIRKGMSIYLFTDGYMDQFGGPNNKKFNTTMFKKLLLDIQLQDMDHQKQAIEDAIVKWKGDYKQIDDMLVMGVKF